MKVAVWMGDGHGRGEVAIERTAWVSWDWREELHYTDELAGMFGESDGGIEKRQ